jgi:hypothetical protein
VTTPINGYPASATVAPSIRCSVSTFTTTPDAFISSTNDLRKSKSVAIPVGWNTHGLIDGHEPLGQQSDSLKSPCNRPPVVVSYLPQRRCLSRRSVRSPLKKLEPSESARLTSAPMAEQRCRRWECAPTAACARNLRWWRRGRLATHASAQPPEMPCGLLQRSSDRDFAIRFP